MVIILVENMEFAGVAQLVERLPCKQDVTGSTPVTGTRYGGALLECKGKALLSQDREGSNPSSSILIKIKEKQIWII